MPLLTPLKPPFTPRILPGRYNELRSTHHHSPSLRADSQELNTQTLNIHLPFPHKALSVRTSISWDEFVGHTPVAFEGHTSPDGDS